LARNLSYYFSLVSPWAYLGHAELGRIAQTRDVVIDYRPVNLMELFPDTGGLPLPKRHPFRQDYRFVEMQRWREARDVPLVLKPKFWPFDFKLADRAMLMASGLGDQDAVHLLVAFAWRSAISLTRRFSPRSRLLQALTQTNSSKPPARTLRQALTRVISSARDRMASLARPLMCSTAKCSGAKIGLVCWMLRLPQDVRLIWLTPDTTNNKDPWETIECSRPSLRLLKSDPSRRRTAS
jgi:hypothetical protein